MNARIKVKETGEILDFAPGSLVCGLRKKEEVEFAVEDIEIIQETTKEIDWQALRHQYAGMAMHASITAPVVDGVDPNPARNK